MLKLQGKRQIKRINQVIWTCAKTMTILLHFSTFSDFSLLIAKIIYKLLQRQQMRDLMQ